MKKVTLFTLVVLLTMVLTAGTSYGQTMPAGPRIVHEEVEITVFDDGKEVEKHIVGKHGDQKNSIIKDAIGKKRTYKEKDVQHPKLKFYNDNGKLVKEIDLTSTTSKGKIKETRPLYKHGEFDAEMVTVKRPKVSMQGKYAAMDNTTYADAGYSVPFGKIVLYDVKGNVLFEKQYPHGRGIADETKIAVTDNGTVAVITSEGEQGENEILYVYDKTGKELLSYPRENEKGRPYDVLKISSNGRYLAARVGFDRARTVFFDLEKNTSWKADRSYVVYDISDGGIVEADYHDDINGKRSTMVTIDLGTRMKP